MNISFFLLSTHILLKVADVATTAYPLQYMGADEINPIVNEAMMLYGMWPALLMIFIAHILMVYFLYIRKLNRTLLITLIPMFIVVNTNLSWIASNV